MARDPGEYRHRVELQASTRTRQPGGGYTDAWATTATVWAAIEPLEATTERIRAMATAASATTLVAMRYRPGLNAKMRVIHRGRTLEVVSPPINPGERDEEIELLCREAAA